jgi:Spy/CpxP family protein refolding chaperone
MIFKLNLYYSRRYKAMLRRSTLIGVLFLVVLLPATLLAQEIMHGKWWHHKSIVSELQLTDSEKKTLDEKYTESRRKMIDLKSEIEKHRFELDLLLGAQDMDKQKIMERYDSLEQTRTQLSKLRFAMLMDVRETIGPDRFQELKSMRRDRDRKEIKRFMRDRSSYRDRD